MIAVQQPWQLVGQEIQLLTERKILRKVKRELVRDMDAHAFLLQMAAEDVFNATEEWSEKKSEANTIEKKIGSCWRFYNQRVQKPMKSSKKYSKLFTIT